MMAPDWAEALAPVAEQLSAMEDFLRAETAEGHSYLPAESEILRAFGEPLADVRVLIVGQDPYPTPGHAMGLSFSVRREVRPLPASLKNIYRELETDLDIAPAAHGDLSAWASQGVLLLNRVLTVRRGEPNSHRRRGWEAITQRAIEALVERERPLVAILWGKPAQTLAPILHDVETITSSHPSPLAAHRGFFGSQPFSRTNALLASQGVKPIEWTLPD